MRMLVGNLINISFWLRCKILSIPLFCTSQWMDIKNASSALYSPMAITVLLMIHLIMFIATTSYGMMVEVTNDNHKTIGSIYSINSRVWTLWSCAFFNSSSSNTTMHSFDDILNVYSMINNINAYKGRQN
jgi:hypothetical protein